MLVKPQFELQPGQVGKGGIVTDPACTRWSSSASAAHCAELGSAVRGYFASSYHRRRRQPRIFCLGIQDGCTRERRDAMTSHLPVSLEFFPGQDGRRRGKDPRRAPGAVCAAPEFCSVTYGAGGSTQEGTFSAIARDPGRGRRPRPALFVRGRHQGQRARAVAGAEGHGRAAHRGACAAICPAAMGPKASSAMPVTWSSSSATRPATISSWRWPRIPETHPRARSPEHDLHAFAMKVKSGANSAITQYFYNPDAYFRFVDDALGAGRDTCRSCPASCRSPIPAS
jgi:hypothetical protein